MTEAFKVISPDGHTYRIFADGSIKGFPKGCQVYNRIPSYAYKAVKQFISSGTWTKPK